MNSQALSYVTETNYWLAGTLQSLPHELLQETERFVYVRLVLSTPFIDKHLHRYLLKLGAECIDEGAPYEAYAIVRDSAELIEDLEAECTILAVEKREPPCCK